MKNFSIAFIFIILSFAPFFSVQAQEDTITIKELQKNIQTLNEEKASKWEKLRQENGKINDFIEEKLGTEEPQKIEEIVNNYYTKKEELEKNIDEKAKQ